MNFKDIFSKRISKVEDNFSQDYLDFHKYFLRTFSDDYAIRHTIQVSDFSKNAQNKIFLIDMPIQLDWSFSNGSLWFKGCGLKKNMFS